MSNLSAAPIRVLVIEDNEDDTVLLTRQLDKAGMIGQVKFIADGMEALNYLRTNENGEASQLMVIFLDLKLPSLGGIELLRHIRTMKAITAIPVIITSTSQNPSDLKVCHELGVANYVEKPVTFSAFAKSMAEAFHLPRENTDRATSPLLK